MGASWVTTAVVGVPPDAPTTEQLDFSTEHFSTEQRDWVQWAEKLESERASKREFVREFDDEIERQCDYILEKLRQEKPKGLEHLEVDELMITYMVQVLSDEEKTTLQKSSMSNMEKASYLLGCIRMKGDKGCMAFMKALVNTRQKEVLDILLTKN